MPTELADGIVQFISTFGFLIILLVAMVFFFIIPQRKKDKKIREMLENLKRGDRIVTIGGIHGKITDLTEKTVTIEVGSDKVQMVMERWSVRDVETNDVVNDSSPIKS